MSDLLKAKDFVSDREAKWCPGCGLFPILRALTSSFAEMGLNKKDQAIVSGIGCSSRFPYYTDVYGFHTIHGRAPTVATGLKLTRPELDVWVVTGDGDGLSIGGNHFIHAIRRNVDLNILLFNNQVYGLTKGQASPTSKEGFVSKSTPMGSVDRPVNASRLALSSGATFVARVLDADLKGMKEIFKQARAHKGTALVEVYFNCVIFNNGSFSDLTSPKLRADNTVSLIPGEPLIYGADKDKGLVLDGLSLKKVDLNEGKYTKDDLVVFDPENETLAYLLSGLEAPDMPVPLGVFRKVSAPVYEKKVQAQITQAKTKFGQGQFDALLKGSDSWKV